MRQTVHRTAQVIVHRIQQCAGQQINVAHHLDSVLVLHGRVEPGQLARKAFNRFTDRQAGIQTPALVTVKAFLGL